MVAGLLTGAALLAVGSLYGAAAAALNPEATDLVTALASVLPSRVLLFLVVVVLAPVAEELYFRGRLYDQVAEGLGNRWALTLTAGIFGVVHGIPILLPAYVLFGIGLALLRRQTGGLIAPVLGHAVNNGVGFWWAG